MDEMVFWPPRGTEQFAMTRFCDGVLMGPKRSSRHKTKHLKKDRRRQLQRRVIQTHAAPDALHVHPHASMSSSSRASTTREPHLECSCVVAVDSLWTRGVCLKWGVRRAQNKRGVPWGVRGGSVPARRAGKFQLCAPTQKCTWCIVSWHGAVGLLDTFANCFLKIKIEARGASRFSLRAGFQHNRTRGVSGIPSDAPGGMGVE